MANAPDETDTPDPDGAGRDPDAPSTGHTDRPEQRATEDDRGMNAAVPTEDPES